MNLALRKPMTLAEFLEWEERQPLRYEFDGVGPVAMTGGTIGHARIQAKSRHRPRRRASAASRVDSYGSDLKFRSRRTTSAIPTAWSSAPRSTGTATVVYDPVVIFEVLSPSTTHNDRIVKAREYQATPSVQRYVMLEQDSVSAAVYARSGEHGRTKSWSPTPFSPCPRSRSSSPSPNSTKAIVFEAQDQSDQPPEGEPA